MLTNDIKLAINGSDTLRPIGIYFRVLLQIMDVTLRATTDMRLRARAHCTSSTLNGGKGGAGPSSPLHTTLEGPTEYMNARWM